MILGAGFAGMQVARELAQLLSREEDGPITLVDQNNVMLFTPMHTEVAGGEVHADHVVSAVHREQALQRLTFRFSQVDDVSLMQATSVWYRRLLSERGLAISTAWRSW